MKGTYRGMKTELARLSPAIRKLVSEFRAELLKTLRQNLVGIYLLGSIAFPGFEPFAGDIDFYVVINRPLNEGEKEELGHLHRGLARKFRFGEGLDGFYIPLVKARRRSTPSGLPYGADGQLGLGGRDKAWALHREHLHRGAYIALYGPKPNEIFPQASWGEIRRGLDNELLFVRKHLCEHPIYAVLNLCRLIYSFETRIIAVSKIEAAGWAIKRLPSPWQKLIRSALRAYHGRGERSDRRLLGENATAFFRFATGRIAETLPTSSS